MSDTVKIIAAIILAIASCLGLWNQKNISDQLKNSLEQTLDQLLVSRKQIKIYDQKILSDQIKMDSILMVNHHYDSLTNALLNSITALSHSYDSLKATIHKPKVYPDFSDFEHIDFFLKWTKPP